MIQTTLNDNSKTRTIITEKFIETGFEYWFTNHEHIRTPFPSEIRSELKIRTSTIFFDWIDGLKKKELSSIKDDEFAEMFETILFNEAMKLVEDEDMKLTIAYPFLPRLGDQVNHGQHGKGAVTARKEVVSKDNKKLFELSILSQQTGQTWETQFELPN